MWEESMYNYNATRRNMLFRVNHSRCIPCMLLAQKKTRCSEDNISTVNRCIFLRFKFKINDSHLSTTGADRTIIEGANIHILVFTDCKNNRFQKKLIKQNAHSPPPPPQLSFWRRHCCQHIATECQT